MKQSMNEILGQFKLEKPKKKVFGNFRIEGEKLIYRAQTTKEIRGFQDFVEWKTAVAKEIRESDAVLINNETGNMVLLESLTKENYNNSSLSIRVFEENLIAVKVKDVESTYFLGNLEILDLIGRTVSYGNENRNNSETEIQALMKAQGFHMISLSSFVGCDFSSFEMLDLGKPLHVSYKKYVGYGRDEITATSTVQALLFKLDDRTYLSDCDRRESRYGKLNYFVKSVHSEARTIEAAYESMKPKAVVEAERDGLKVKRIGSLYLIETKPPKIPELSQDEKFAIMFEKAGFRHENRVLSYVSGLTGPQAERIAKDAIKKVPRPESFENYHIDTFVEIDGVAYATGKVSSDHRATIELETWFRLSLSKPRKGA